MENIRRRIPFKLADEDNGQDLNAVLDEEEQDALIEDLRKENENVNQAYFKVLTVLVGLSAALQLITFSKNPLLSIFPITSQKPSLPLPGIFVLLSLFIHANLALLFFSDQLGTRLELSSPPRPLSFQLLYSLSSVPPVLALFLSKPWQTTIWWCVTPVMVFIVQTVLDTIQGSTERIAELETLKYRAPGA